MKCFLFHDWDKWEQYTWQGRVKYNWQKEWNDCVEYRQKRKCKKCGKVEDVKV